MKDVEKSFAAWWFGQLRHTTCEIEESRRLEEEEYIQAAQDKEDLLNDFQRRLI